jgi:hypothetical protein
MFGLGNGTFSGSPSLIVTRGLGIGEAVTVTVVVGATYALNGPNVAAYELNGPNVAAYELQ